MLVKTGHFYMNSNYTSCPCRGKHLSLYGLIQISTPELNGRKKRSVSDNTSSSGSISVVVRSLMNSNTTAEVAFNDVKVWTL